MLKLFQSIFGSNEKRGQHPESLIEMAIERAVDGTYPRCGRCPVTASACAIRSSMRLIMQFHWSINCPRRSRRLPPSTPRIPGFRHCSFHPNTCGRS